MVKSALKILWRQCSLLACANIISSTSVGLRASRAKAADQVVDLVGRQRQAELGVGLLPARRVPAPSTSTSAIGSACAFVEQVPRLLARAGLEGHAFGHAVVQQRRGGLASSSADSGLARAQQPALQLQPVLGDPLDAVQRQAAVVGDVGGLAGPGRHGAQARHHQHHLAVGRQPARGRHRSAARPACPARRGPAARRSRPSAHGGRVTPVTRGQAAASRASRAWARKADRALPPSKCSRCLGAVDMRGWGGGDLGRRGLADGRPRFYGPGGIIPAR